MNLNLSKWLNQTISTNLVLINANSDCYPLVNLAINQLKSQLTNYTSHNFTAERYFDYHELMSLIANNSLFGDKNYIEINHKTKPTLEQQQQLLNLIDKLDENCLILITTELLTKKDYAETWYQAINEKGQILKLSESDTFAAIKYKFDQALIEIEDKAIDFLITLNQANLINLFQEVNKLCLLYKSGTKLNLQDIQNIDDSKYNIYQLSNNYLKGDLANSIKILNNIYQDTEDAILISWIIGEDLRKLLKLKSKLRQNLSVSQIMRDLKIWGDAINNFQLAEKHLSYLKLLKLLDKLSQLDLSIKGINQEDVKQKLTEIIIAFCNKTY